MTGSERTSPDSTGVLKIQGRSILIIRPGALGDTILALPAIRALRHAAGPTGRVELVGYSQHARVALNPSLADAVHSIDRALFAGLYSKPETPDLENFLRGYGLIVAWSTDPDGHLGRLLERLRAVHILAHPFPVAGSGVHASDHLLHTLQPLRIPLSVAHPRLLDMDPECGVAARQFLFDVGIGDLSFVGLHVGSGSARKNWSADKFAELAHLARTAGLECLFIEGEADREPMSRLRRILSWEPQVARNLNLTVLSSLLSRAVAYVGNDSGITHLAAAAGTPTVALFGPTVPELWAPRGPWIRVLTHGAHAAQVWREIRNLPIQSTIEK
jgi:heptosyltransferase-3